MESRLKIKNGVVTTFGLRGVPVKFPEKEFERIINDFEFKEDVHAFNNLKRITLTATHKKLPLIFIENSNVEIHNDNDELELSNLYDVIKWNILQTLICGIAQEVKMPGWSKHSLHYGAYDGRLYTIIDGKKVYE